MNGKRKKTAKPDDGAPEKKLNRWERESPNPEVREGSMSFMLDDQGNVYPIPAEYHLKAIEQVNATGGEGDFLTRLGQVRQANRQMDKRAGEAMTVLLLWAQLAGIIEYYDKLTPDDQRDLLNMFDDDVEAGIKRAKFEKRRYDTIDQAYLWIESKMIRFRKGRGVPNDKHLSQKLAKEFWEKYGDLKRWRKYVERHGGNERALQRGVLRR